MDSSSQRKLPLVHANQKLGQGIWHFSLPAGDTCPGETKACATACYAKKGTFLFASTRKRLADNNEMRMADDFAARVGAQITLQNVQYLRVHASGDFDSVDYIQVWRRIAMRKPKVTYWTYTRSWTDESTAMSGQNMVPALTQLGALSQFHLWLSCDVDTGEPVAIPNARRAYMSKSDEDVPSYPVDLMFRTDRRTRQTQLAGATVCPVEREIKRDDSGRRLKPKVTCSNCQLCFSRVETLDALNQSVRQRLPVISI